MIEGIRWPDGVTCPHCGTVDAATKLHGAAHRPGLYQCNSCRGQFTVTTGTVMHRSRISLVKWVIAVYLICSSKKGASALQVQRQIGIGNYQTAWHLCHRIRYAMAHGWDAKLGADGGTVEADECYTGGKPRRGDRAKKGMGKRGRGTKKTPVVALIDRERGRAIAVPVADVSSEVVGALLDRHVDKSARLMTDEANVYIVKGREFEGGHRTTKHSLDEFSRREIDHVTGAAIVVHSNTAESFFSLLKRQHIGAHHHWSPEHLHRYLAELTFRWDRRKDSDYSRTVDAIKGMEGKRLTYDALPSGSAWQ